MNSTRARLVRDAFAALWWSVLAGIAAALTLAMIVVALASVAHAQTREGMGVQKPQGELSRLTLQTPTCYENDPRRCSLRKPGVGAADLNARGRDRVSRLASVRQTAPSL